MTQTRNTLPYVPPRMEATEVRIERGFSASEINDHDYSIGDWNESDPLDGFIF